MRRVPSVVNPDMADCRSESRPGRPHLPKRSLMSRGVLMARTRSKSSASSTVTVGVEGGAARQWLSVVSLKLYMCFYSLSQTPKDTTRDPPLAAIAACRKTSPTCRNRSTTASGTPPFIATWNLTPTSPAFPPSPRVTSMVIAVTDSAVASTAAAKLSAFSRFCRSVGVPA